MDKLDASTLQGPPASEQEQQPPELEEQPTRSNKTSRSVMTQTGEIKKAIQTFCPKAHTRIWPSPKVYKEV